jgi:hypothetical protein
VRIGKNLEVPFIWRELRRVVDICECQAWDSQVSKFRVGHVPRLNGSCMESDLSRSSLMKIRDSFLPFLSMCEAAGM